jgi:signal transduction histidine kinase
MFLRPLKDLPKTVGFHLIVWYSGIFILGSLLLFSVMYLILSSSLNKEDREMIQLKLKELSAIYQTGGMEALEREVTVEKKFERENPFFVRLAGQENNTLFLIIPYQWAEFDIKQLETITSNTNMTWVRLPAKNDKYVLEVASIGLPNGCLLQAGKSTEERENILRHFRGVFASVTIPLIVFGFIGGIFLSFRALQPIRHVTNTIRSVSSGRMDARVPSPQTGDELDELVILFNRMVEKIETLINGMRDSLDNVAHDLRTPMTRLRGMAEMALQSANNSGICREALADCLEESERIIKMLDTLMDISEAETGVMRLDQKNVNALEMIEDVVELYRYVAEDKGILVHTWCSKDLCLTADPNRMRQVLANLLDNAIKYTPTGGTIDITAERGQHTIIMMVKDTGIGIDPEELPRIWDRLYRCDQSRSQKGLGLGLSLVKAIIQAHKGQVEVFSEPGKGSTFCITLPAAN